MVTAPGEGLSQAGAILGTPGYMAPEQAHGDTEQMDERSDVFGLGAILCQVLTGRPPFHGAAVQELLVKSALGELDEVFARLDGCGADGELVRLAKACLAAERDQRPANGGAVAAQVGTYLAGVQDRLRQAEVGQARAEARAEGERKRRRLTLALAASVLLTVLLGGGGYAWLQQQRAERRAGMVRAIDAALDNAAALGGRAAAAHVGDLGGWGEALAEAKRAEDLLEQGEADEKLRERVAAVRDNLERDRDEARRRANEAAAERRLVVRLEAIRAERGEHFDMKRADREYAEAFRAFGLDLDAIDPNEAGARLAGRPATAEIAAALDDWCSLWFLHKSDEKRPAVVAAGRGGASSGPRPLAKPVARIAAQAGFRQRP